MQTNTAQRAAMAVTRSIGSPTSIVVHSLLFFISFGAAWLGIIAFDRMLLVLTTIVSLEAIYLSIFIQMTINYQSESIEEVEKDIDEIQEDVGEIQEDIDEIQEDVDELQEDVEDIGEDVEEMSGEDKKEHERDAVQQKALAGIQRDLQKLIHDIETLRSQN